MVMFHCICSNKSACSPKTGFAMDSNGSFFILHNLQKLIYYGHAGCSAIGEK